MKKIRVLVSDDHPVYREGLCRFLENEEDIEVVARSADGEETVRLARKMRPDVAVIDVALLGINGIEAAKQIKADFPTVAVLILSAFGYESYVLAALQAQASGYMLKNAPISELISAIRLVHAGDAVFDLKAINRVLRPLADEKDDGSRKYGKLQRREIQVLKLVARGMTNKEVSRQLTISARTVQTHLVNIFRKLQVSSRTEAVLRALREGWLTLDELP